MGMAIDIYECSRCGNEVFSDIDTSIGDFVNFCRSCGFEDSRLAVEDDNGDLLPDDEGFIMFEYIQNDGFGVLNLEYKDDTRKSTVFDEVPSNEEIVECLHQLNIDDNLLIDNCYLTVWNEDEQKLDVLFGELPHYFGDEKTEKEVRIDKKDKDESKLPYVDDNNFAMFDDIPF